MIICIASALIAGAYGVLHDEITFAISQEYYSKFKFAQFGLTQQGQIWQIENIPLAVAQVGFAATWWLGLLIGIVLAVDTRKVMPQRLRLIICIKAIAIVMIATFVFGCIGYVVGAYAQGKIDANYLPQNIVNKKNFIAVGMIHNCGYIGAICGLVIAWWFARKQKRIYNA